MVSINTQSATGKSNTPCHIKHHGYHLEVYENFKVDYPTSTDCDLRQNAILSCSYRLI